MQQSTFRRPDRKSYTTAVVLLMLFGCFILAPSALIAKEPFIFVSLPDTQVYSENRFPDNRYPAVTDTRGTAAIYFDQTNWIVDNFSELPIGYVGHLGDIVQDGNNLDEWARAKAAMNLMLDADIPHGTVMGNHDDNHGSDYRKNYLDHFGPQVFAGKAWYTASSPGGGANFQLIEHEGIKLGFLNFSIDQPQAEINWATQIVENHPDTIFIIGTHRYLVDFKLIAGRYGETVDSILGSFDIPPDNPVSGVVDPNSGEELFNQFVSRHQNIMMIHAGHFHSEWLRLDGLNSGNQMIVQILTDYQSTRNGGDGWLRIYEMDFDDNSLSFQTFSPTLNRFRTTIDHFVETIHTAYVERFQVMAALGLTEEEYFALLESLKDVEAVPDGFLLLHPDYNEPAEQAYYATYLNELFLGNIPDGFDNIVEWEGLWLQAFAANPFNPFDFSDGARSPRRTISVDYAAYVEKKGDLNGDGVVDAEDFKALRKAFGRCDGDPDFNTKADFDGDNCVSYRDYRIWYGHYKDANQ
jgi:hypothetical protein